MTPADLDQAQAIYEAAHGGTPLACTSTRQTIEAHQGELEDAIAGQMAVITYWDSVVREAQSKRDAAKDRKRVLEMDFEKCKRAYWSLRDEERRTQPST